MDNSRRLLDYYLPPAEGFVLESLVATTYQVDFEFLEEELLAAAVGVRSPSSRVKAFRCELERRLQATEVSVLYDLRGCPRLARLSPRIDPIPIVERKLHSKISLLMWVRQASDLQQPPDRRMRLVVGSANLTRQGFRENFECVAALDFGGRSGASRALLVEAIRLVRRIADVAGSPQLERQLQVFESEAARLNDESDADDAPTDIVDAERVLPTIRARWGEMTADPPKALTIVSPFWPEGATGANALLDVVNVLQSPDSIEFACRSALSPDGRTWLPEFDAEMATLVRQQVSGRLFLRPALPNTVSVEVDSPVDEGDETEDATVGQAATALDNNEVCRALHAKMILLDGPAGSVLYTGSSNCTRRGLALKGPSNWETGFVYRLRPRQRKQLQSLLEFLGPVIEVLPDQAPKTADPVREAEPAVPTFIDAITAEGPNITVHLREGVPVPDDLVMLMQIPSRAMDDAYWLLYQRSAEVPENQTIRRNLEDCPRCDATLVQLAPSQIEGPVIPHVLVEVRWQGHVASFPVRFDDKATLPVLLIGRKPTEGELIEYFLFGREPEEDLAGDFDLAAAGCSPTNDEPINTRRILAYFIRRFVQAIPGMEAEIRRSSYSRAALDAALRGPTSPLELAERAYASLSRPPARDEPVKSATAVGFQLTEILALLLRGQAQIADASLKDCFVPAISRCQELVRSLSDAHPELNSGTFRLYQQRFAGESV